MTTILSSADYPAIRHALDVALDVHRLPDATIAMSIYLVAADLEIKRRAPDYASYTGDQATHLANAAIYLTASLLAPVVPNLVRESVGDGDQTYQRQMLTPQEQALRLRGLADAELTAASEVTTASTMPTFFVLAPGNRALNRSRT